MVIIEDFRRLRKAHAMLLLVFLSLLRIPFEYQHRASNSNLTFGFKRAPRAAVALQAAVRWHAHLTCYAAEVRDGARGRCLG